LKPLNTVQVSVIWGKFTPAGQSSSGVPFDTSSGSTSSGTGNTGGGNTGGSGSSNSTTSSTSTNSTSVYTNGTLSCLNPPDTYMGLPTAPCGEDFDETLDNKIGYFDFGGSEDATDFADFIPGVDVESNSTTTNSTTPTSRRRRSELARQAYHQKRWGWSNPFKKVSTFPKAPADIQLASAVSNGLKAAGNAIKSTASAAYNAAASGVSTLGNIVKSGLSALSNPSFDKTLPIDVGPSKTSLVDSVFGTANSYLVYNASTSEGAAVQGAVQIYCVDCGVHGTATIHGALEYKIRKWQRDVIGDAELMILKSPCLS
jgi:hypothetical protein